MNRGSAVADHEIVFAVGDDILHVLRESEHQRVLVAQVLHRLAVVENDFHDEGADCGVEDLVCHAGLDEALVLSLAVLPLIAHENDSGNDACLLA